MKQYLIFIVLVGSLLSCQKEADQVDDRKRLLTSGVWHIVKAEEKEGTEPWLDVFPYWAACDQDNTWKFQTDMSLEYNESDLACSPGSAHQILDIVVWSLPADPSKLIVDELEYVIEKLDDTSLIVVVSETYGGVQSSRRVTFIH